MRSPAVLLVALCLLPGSALAQSSVVERLLALSRESNSECRRQQLPQPALAAACQSARSYDEALGRLGFCFDDEMAEWTSCALAGTSRGSQTAPRPAAPEAAPGEPGELETMPPAAGENYSAPGPQENAEGDPQPEAQPESQGEPQAEPEPLPQSPPESPPVPETYTPPEPGDQPELDAELKPSQGGWRTYSNGRFGTVVDVPPGFEPRTEVENGDGQTFASADGESEVAVYGSVLEDQSMRQYRDWYRSELSGKSYEAGGNNWFVISGTAEGKIYYVKVVRTAHCGVPVVHHMVFRYPASQKRRFDPVVEQLADSLRGTRQSSFCEG